MEKQFLLEDAICKIGKISNNLEKHGDEDVTEFNLPVFDLILTNEQLGELYGDPYTHRSWFNINGGLQQPMDWLKAASPIGNDVIFEGIEATIRLPSDEELEFSNCRAKDFQFTGVVGGTELTFKLQLCPGLGRENLLLQEYQNREVRLSIADAKIALKKKGRQKDLPLQQPPEQELARSSEAELEEARQRDETERQLGEALRGLEKQRPADQVDGSDAANDGESGNEAA